MKTTFFILLGGAFYVVARKYRQTCHPMYLKISHLLLSKSLYQSFIRFLLSLETQSDRSSSQPTRTCGTNEVPASCKPCDQFCNEETQFCTLVITVAVKVTVFFFVFLIFFYFFFFFHHLLVLIKIFTT